MAEQTTQIRAWLSDLRDCIALPVGVRDGDPVQIPDAHLPKNDKPAAFRVFPLKPFRAGGGGPSDPSG